jgi:hypothetical protein
VASYNDLAEAVAIEEAVADEPNVAFDEAMKRVTGILRDYRSDGELMAYMRHVRRGAIDAVVKLTEVDVDEKSEIISLQARIRDYTRLCRYIADVMGVARATLEANAIEDGGGNFNGG